MKIHFFLSLYIVSIQSKQVDQSSNWFSSSIEQVTTFANQWIQINDQLGNYENQTFNQFLPSKQMKKIDQTKICSDKANQFTGYIDVGTSEQPQSLFYWLVESRRNPSKDPLILWLNGGPGCSSMLGYLMEMGPCIITSNTTKPQYNPYSWNDRANVVYLDQPIGTGFSIGSNHNYSLNNTLEASQFVMTFLIEFFELYPKFKTNPFHIFGESYAGHYIPEIGKLILDFNDQIDKNLKIPLTSVGIGNGIVDSLTQYRYYPIMACNSDGKQLYNATTCQHMLNSWPKCETIIRKCYHSNSDDDCREASEFCFQNVGFPGTQDSFNMYDVSKECLGSHLCYSQIQNIESWLNLNSTRSVLGVEMDSSLKYQACNTGINQSFSLAGGSTKPSHYSVVQLLSNRVKVLIYNGELDYICNHLGAKAWTLNLPWTGQNQFRNISEQLWYNKANGQLAGQVRESDLLTFVRGYGGGHMFPMDQKENSLDLINRWLDNKSLIN